MTEAIAPLVILVDADACPVKDEAPQAVISVYAPTDLVYGYEHPLWPDIVRGTGVAVFSDEPYCHMVWKGEHVSLLAQPGMLDQCMAAYTFSKSYSMSGWRLGFSVASAEVTDAIGKMIKDDGGTHPVKTVGGCTLQAKMDGDKITLTDENQLWGMPIAETRDRISFFTVMGKISVAKARIKSREKVESDEAFR